MADYLVKPLDANTWDAFVRLVERHNGVFGGTWFQTFEEGSAHAALVFDADEAVAWCQYGSPEELPNIHHRQEYEAHGPCTSGAASATSVPKARGTA